jgi:Na+-transporting methylmalonyl-CoA/oxaloacetate decarboxylase beta subunit
MKKTEVLYIIAGLIVLIIALLSIARVFDRPEGIGIIGGADAPTAIFVLRRIDKKKLILLAAGAILLIRGLAGAAKSKR